MAPGDRVTFYVYASSIDTGKHNVVADDGSFRCARGCDGDGGDGNPAFRDWSFARTFTRVGRVSFHDEVSGVRGSIIVTTEPTIGPATTGAWFDPVQSGHGLLVEVLPGNRVLAAWLAFDATGQQAWFMGVGPHDGSKATISLMEQPTGGRWIPNFDARHVTRRFWGTLTLTFYDCDHGRAEYNANADFGRGAMNLTRLTLPAGLACH